MFGIWYHDVCEDVDHAKFEHSKSRWYWAIPDNKDTSPWNIIVSWGLDSSFNDVQGEVLLQPIACLGSLWYRLRTINLS